MRSPLRVRRRPTVDEATTSILKSVGARLVSFIPQTVATLVLTRLIIEVYGVEAFSAFSLMLAVIYLLPVRSIGVGVAVTTSIAADGPGSEQAHRTLLTASRIMAIAAVITAVGALAITAAGLWPFLLGEASGGSANYGLGLVILALSVVPGLAADILLGVDRNHVVIIGQALVMPVVAILLGALILSGAPWQMVILTPPAAMLVVNLGLARLAHRWARVRWGSVARDLVDRRKPGVRVRSTAGPMAVIAVVAPIATQMDRIIISHVNDAAQVAAYALAIQLFGPAISIVNAVAQPLWPRFVAAYAEGGPGPSLAKLVPIFTAGSLLLAAVLVPLAYFAAPIIVDGQVEFTWGLALAGAGWFVSLAIAAPISSAMMDPAGLNRMAIFGVLGLPTNLIISVVLAEHMGAAGPIWASAIVLLLPLVPFYMFLRKRQRAATLRPDAEPIDADQVGTS